MENFFFVCSDDFLLRFSILFLSSTTLFHLKLHKAWWVEIVIRQSVRVFYEEILGEKNTHVLKLILN